MIDFFKNVLGETSSESSSDDRPHDVNLAACALLLEMANIDDEFSEDERAMILTILKEEYGISEENARRLAEEAEKQRKASLDLWHFTRLINEHFSREEKIRIVELLWRIVFVDGKLDGHEDYLVHSLADMLNLSHRDLIDAKLAVLRGNDE